MPTATLSNRPVAGEFAAYYGKYIALVPDGDIIATLTWQQMELLTFLRSVPETKADVLHAPYTWTLKQVVNHLNDGERIFAYRALRIARADPTPLPGFDENDYAKTAETSRLTLGQHTAEFETVRSATLSLLRSFSDEAWTRTGTANGNPVSVRGLAWIMAGHVIHHLAIMRKRVGK